MDLEQVKSLLLEQLNLEEAIVKSDGSHFQITAVGECFVGLSRVKQQQLVLKLFSDDIANGSMHAITVKAYTPEGWAKDKKLQMLL